MPAPAARARLLREKPVYIAQIMRSRMRDVARLKFLDSQLLEVSAALPCLKNTLILRVVRSRVVGELPGGGVSGNRQLVIEVNNTTLSGVSRASSHAQVSIETLGRFSLRVSGEEIILRNQKSKAIVAYLAVSDYPEEARERLVGLLWSESETAKARSSLRTCLHEIRGAFHAIGYNGLRSDKLKIGLIPDGLHIDLKDVLAEAAAGRAHRLLFERERLLDDLLPGFEELDPGLASWLVPKRRALHDRLVRDLKVAMREPATCPDVRGQLARALLRLDPTDEEAARSLIRARCNEGDIGAALAIYKKLWDLLEEEYDVEPSRETLDLIAQIRLEQPHDEVGAGAVGASSFAVPARASLTPAIQRGRAASRLVVSLGTFNDGGIPAESRYLVQEFKRELIANLVRFREWVVRDLPPNRPPSQDIAGDEVVLEGGGYQTENGIRLVLTLREAAEGAYLWSEKLDISAERWWGSQQEVVRRMAAALNVHISASRLAAIARRPHADLLAHDLWLRGQAIKISFRAEDWHTAAQLFRDLIQQKPQFAPAYSSLAQLHNSIHVTHYGVMRDHDRRAEALQCAREAVRLDPTDSRSQLCLGWAYLMAHQHDQATVHFDVACELNDNDPWTLTSAALGFAFSGDHRRARALADQSLELSSTFSGPQWGYQARVRFLGEDYAGAAAAAERASDAPALAAWKAAIMCRLGRNDAGLTELERFFVLSRENWCGMIQWSREAAITWFLSAFPIRLAEDWERLRQAMRLAGAPVDHIQWSDVNFVA